MYYLSGEFLLRDRPNGGTVVLLRSLLVTVLLYAVAVFAREVLHPKAVFEFSLKHVRGTAWDTIPWAGAIFAGVYAALYSRFASQWAYLAGVYNEIMAAKVELNGVRPPALDTWEAGFLEDADELHLAMKPMFAGVVKSLAENENVRKQFIEGTAGGEARLDDLIARAQRAYDAAEKRHLARRRKKPPASAPRTDT